MRFLPTRAKGIKMHSMPSLPISPRRIGIAAGLLVLALLVIEFNTRLDELNQLNVERERVRAMATQSMQTQIALQTEVAYAQSDQAAEEWARSEGHYILPGDRPVVPIGEPGAEPLVDYTPTPVPTPLPNWQVWWNLFFSE